MKGSWGPWGTPGAQFLNLCFHGLLIRHVEAWIRSAEGFLLGWVSVAHFRAQGDSEETVNVASDPLGPQSTQGGKSLTVRDQRGSPSGRALWQGRH